MGPQDAHNGGFETLCSCYQVVGSKKFIWSNMSSCGFGLWNFESGARHVFLHISGVTVRGWGIFLRLCAWVVGCVPVYWPYVGSTQWCSNIRSH
jgi:hypothetical protein